MFGWQTARALLVGCEGRKEKKKKKKAVRGATARRQQFKLQPVICLFVCARILAPMAVLQIHVHHMRLQATEGWSKDQL